MRVGIVGSEAAKFTPDSEQRAKEIIRTILHQGAVTEVVSGGCHLGGIDQWAEEIGNELSLNVTIFKPKTQNWTNGYKERNLLIAKRSDAVYCLTVDKLPAGYTGMTFNYCYHCKKNDHVKSGGCWTVKQAQKLDKYGGVIVISQEGYKCDSIC